MRIQLVGTDNGSGLTQDVQVLREALEPRHEVIFTDWKRPRKVPTRHFDANIFLELINPAFFDQAHRNYGLLNPEWTDGGTQRNMKGLDLILAKTRDGESIYGAIQPTTYTGFTSIDKYDESVPRELKFLHVAGKSSAKGTREVVVAFALSKTPLTIIGTDHVPKDLPAWVTHHTRVDEQTLRQMMNSHTVHVCTSSYEGFGHYINEARSVGALIITTNAPPMNELCTPDFAFGAGFNRVTPQHLGTHRHVDVGQLVSLIDTVKELPMSLIQDLGNKARTAYLKGKVDFHAKMKELFP